MDRRRRLMPVEVVNDSRGVACLILLLLLGGVLAVYGIVQSVRVEASSRGATPVLASLLTGRTSGRPQIGYIPSAETTAVPTMEAVASAPPLAEPSAQPTVSAEPTPTPDRFRVAKTDGLGVALHTAPNNAARLARALAEGALVTVLERVGLDWARVRADDGQEGWVGAAYLLPAE